MSKRQDISPTKPGYRRGCFGGTTLAKRREEHGRFRGAALSFATRYVRSRAKASRRYAKRIEDDKGYEREVEKAMRKQLRKLRGIDNRKRTTKACKS